MAEESVEQGSPDPTQPIRTPIPPVDAEAEREKLGNLKWDTPEDRTRGLTQGEGDDRRTVKHRPQY